MVKHHCDFCQCVISDRVNTAEFYAQDKRRYKFSVELSRIREDKSRGVRWEKTECCLGCLVEYVAALLDQKEEESPSI